MKVDLGDYGAAGEPIPDEADPVNREPPPDQDGDPGPGGHSVDSANGSGPPWDDPIPFGVPVELPTFPVEAFPGLFAEHAAALAANAQVAPDMPAMMQLGVWSTALQGKFRIRRKPGGLYTEPLCTWPMVVSPPANRKSAVHSPMFEPIRKYQQDEDKRQRQAYESSESMRAALANEISKATNKLASDDTEEHRDRLADLQRRLAELPSSTRPPVMLGNDASPEVVAVRMAEHGRFTLASAEGDEVFSLMSGRYSEGSNLDIYLKGHAEDTHIVDRLGRPPIYIPRPTLTVALMVQPQVLQSRGKDAGMRGRGLFGRFLYSIPRSLLGSRTFDSPDVPSDLVARYQAAVIGLCSHAVQRREDGSWDAKLIEVSPEAREVLSSWHDEVEPDLNPDTGRFSEVADWAGKLEGATLRIAGLLHAASRSGDPSLYPVSADTAERAVRIARYLVPHALAAFELMGAQSEVETRARRVVRWICDHPWTSFTERDCYRALGGKLFGGDVGNVRPVMEELETRNYLRSKAETGRLGPGRKGSPRWLVNPRIRSHNRQNGPGGA